MEKLQVRKCPKFQRIALIFRTQRRTLNSKGGKKRSSRGEMGRSYGSFWVIGMKGMRGKGLHQYDGSPDLTPLRYRIKTNKRTSSEKVLIRGTVRQCYELLKG